MLFPEGAHLSPLGSCLVGLIKIAASSCHSTIKGCISRLTEIIRFLLPFFSGQVTIPIMAVFVRTCFFNYDFRKYKGRKKGIKCMKRSTENFCVINMAYINRNPPRTCFQLDV